MGLLYILIEIYMLLCGSCMEATEGQYWFSGFNIHTLLYSLLQMIVYVIRNKHFMLVFVLK